MARFIDFFVNHWVLSGLWIVLMAVFIAYQKSKSGKTVSPQEATLLVNRSEGVLLDIRERKEFEKGHIVDSINIPLAKLDERITELEKHKEKPVIVICNMGHHAGDALKQLEEKGFTDVCRMTGGISEWRAQALPLVQ